MELKHFTLQYNYWKDSLNAIDIYPSRSKNEIKSINIDPTFSIVELREKYLHRIELVNEAVKIAGGEISEILLYSVTNDISYARLSAQGAPFGRDYYYERYRKYFYILDRIRD